MPIGRRRWDLLIHETFPSPRVYAQKAGMPLEFAEAVVNGVHTSPVMAGKVFDRVGARMSAMWHLAVDHDTVGSANAVVTRQAVLDPCPWPVLGPTSVVGPPMNPIPEPPAWWAQAAFLG